MDKIYNTVSKRYLKIDGQQYKILIKQGYYIKDGQLVHDKTSKSSKSPKLSKKFKKSPIFQISNKDLFINVIKDLSPNDLLSLYLTNKEFVFDQIVLDYLSNKFKVDKVNNFLEFIQLFNLSIVNPYLYQLENKITIPTVQFRDELLKSKRNVTAKMIAILHDWLLEINRIFKTNNYIPGLTMTLLLDYLMNVDLKKEELQGLGVVCHHLACLLLEEYPPDISNYVYITDGTVDHKKFNEIKKDVLNVLNGMIIRPSTVFFVDMNNEDIKNMTLASYTDIRLAIYKPSLIAETITYIVTGNYKIYTLDEIAQVCRILIKLINNLHKSSLTRCKYYANLLSKYDNYQCGIKVIDIKESPIRTQQPWHIGEYELDKVVGEGTYGKVTKIKRKECNKDYVIKTNTDEYHVIEAINEIAILKTLSEFKSINNINLCGFNIKSDEEIDLYLPYMSNDLLTMINKNIFDFSKFKKYATQMINGLYELHRCDIIHRDIKQNNIVYDAQSDMFKLIDYGISTPYSSVRRLIPDMASSFQFRAPEALFELQYNTKIDIWAIANVFYYIFTKKYIVNDMNEKKALNEIFQLFGTPTQMEWPNMSQKYKEYDIQEYPGNEEKLKNIFGEYYYFIRPCFICNPDKRPSAQQLLKMI